MRAKPRIAIVASFPIWLLENDVPKPKGHYAVWLASLYELLKSVDTYEFHWICVGKNVLWPRKVKHANQIFHVLPAVSLELSSRMNFIWDRFWIQCLLRRLAPDLIHVWGTESRWAPATYSFRAKKIISMQGILSAYQRLCPMGNYMRNRARQEPFLLPYFDLVTSESDWGCARSREVSPLSRVVRWEYAAEELFWGKERRLSQEPTCLMAGSDTPIKNVDTAIKAFSRPGLSHVTLLLAGVKPEDRPNLPPNIVALGRVSRERMLELLSSSWGLVHPTLADTSPNIVKEARVVGLPVITTTECGGAQYVDDGKSGFIIKPRDVEALQQAVLKMTADAETSLRMGSWQHEQCRSLLGRETMKNRLLQIYDAVLNDKEAELR